MVWGVDGSAGDSDLAWQYHYMLNEYRLHEKLCGFVFTEFHDVVNEFNGYYRIDDTDKDFGYQDHEMAVREQLNASILILPLRKEPEYRAVLPGKLFEYLASRRPILGIGQTDGAMARIVGETGSGVVYDWDDEKKIRAWIDFCWDEFKNDELHDNTSDISRFTRRNLTVKLAELLNQITEK